MKKTFAFEFDDQSAAAAGRPNDAISFDFSGDESLKVQIYEGAPMIWANRAGLIALGKVLLKMGLSEYEPGFHIHFRADFSDDANLSDVITIGVAK